MTLLSGARHDRSTLLFTEKIAQPNDAVRNPAKQAEAVAVKNENGDMNYRVKKGDTLFHIAIDNLPNSISIDQMLVALYRATETAFIDKNIHRLHSGQILSIPDGDTVRVVKPAPRHLM
ncbi:MAG: LysM peptidoglycan-binding domain-containing protein [Glaciimonas sp.]|nr:LysM peptidoglycan-binding domain-containing protein [Glaciimonas sp.]